MTDVVAAVIRRNGRVLIARRSEGKLSGKWEFPGGKVENGENPKAALKREIREEFGVSISIKEFLDQSLFQIEENPFRLLAYFAEMKEDEIFPTEHDRIEWVLPGELLKYDLAGPDIPIARKLIRNS